MFRRLILGVADQFPQATSVDPQEVVDLSFVKQVEGAR